MNKYVYCNSSNKKNTMNYIEKEMLIFEKCSFLSSQGSERNLTTLHAKAGGKAQPRFLLPEPL